MACSRLQPAAARMRCALSLTGQQSNLIGATLLGPEATPQLVSLRAFSAQHRWAPSACRRHLSTTWPIQRGFTGCQSHKARAYDAQRSEVCETTTAIALRNSTEHGLPLQRLERAVTPEVAHDLQARGFAVLDGVFGSDSAAALRQEISALRQVLPGAASRHTSCPNGSEVLSASRSQREPTGTDPLVDGC